jgi:hypothetical protein
VFSGECLAAAFCIGLRVRYLACSTIWMVIYGDGVLVFGYMLKRAVRVGRVYNYLDPSYVAHEEEQYAEELLQTMFAPILDLWSALGPVCDLVISSTKKLALNISLLATYVLKHAYQMHHPFLPSITQSSNISNSPKSLKTFLVP